MYRRKTITTQKIKPVSHSLYSESIFGEYVHSCFHKGCRKKKSARDNPNRYRGKFSDHGSFPSGFQGKLRKRHCKEEAS